MGEWFEKKTLGTLLEEAARRWGPREALFYEGQRWSFAHLMFRLQSNRPCRYDVLDDHPTVLHHNPVYY